MNHKLSYIYVNVNLLANKQTENLILPTKYLKNTKLRHIKKIMKERLVISRVTKH